MDQIRVMLADDESAVLEAIADLISADPTIDLVGTARDAKDAIRLATNATPDVALVDLRMPGGGTTTARQIRRACPDTRVVALSVSTDADDVISMLRAGAIGYVAKDASTDHVLRAIHRSVEGRTTISVDSLGEVTERLAEFLAERTNSSRNAAARRIERAIDEDVVQVVFQPIIELSGRRVVGLEALSRFSLGPRRSPQTWFAEAAHVGLLTELELAAASLALAQLHRVPVGVYLAINASPVTLQAPALPDLLEGVRGGRVVLEMTEQSPVEDYDALIASIRPLRDAGVRLSIDDVGTGFAGLGHVVCLSPDYIKLDRTLVADVDRDPTRKALIVRLVSFADEVGMGLIAEGVETRGELLALERLGVRYAQGFHLGRPGPIPDGQDQVGQDLCGLGPEAPRKVAIVLNELPAGQLRRR